MRILRRHVSSSHCLFHRRRRNNILSTARRRRRRRRRFKAHRRRAAGRSARSKKQHHRTAHIVRVCSRVRKERWMEKRAPKFFCGGEEGNFIQNFLMCFVCVHMGKDMHKKRCSQYAKISKALLVSHTYILQSLVLDRFVLVTANRQICTEAILVRCTCRRRVYPGRFHTPDIGRAALLLLFF